MTAADLRHLALALARAAAERGLAACARVDVLLAQLRAVLR